MTAARLSLNNQISKIQYDNIPLHRHFSMTPDPEDDGHYVTHKLYANLGCNSEPEGHASSLNGVSWQPTTDTDQ